MVTESFKGFLRTENWNVKSFIPLLSIPYILLGMFNLWTNSFSLEISLLKDAKMLMGSLFWVPFSFPPWLFRSCATVLDLPAITIFMTRCAYLFLSILIKMLTIPFPLNSTKTMLTFFLKRCNFFFTDKSRKNNRKKNFKISIFLFLFN